MHGDGWRADRIAALRRAFDETFAREADVADDAFDDLLTIRVAGDAFALRLSEIAGVHQRRPITPLPGAPPALLGLSGVRGRLVAVHDLARALGYPQADAPHRWLALCRGEDRVALSLGEVEGYVRARRGRITALGRDADRRRCVDAAFDDGSVLRGVVSVPAVLAALRGGAAGALAKG